MTIELQMWQAITLMIAFFGAVAGSAKMLFSQFEKNLGERFQAQETAAATANKTIHEALSRHMAEEGKTIGKVFDLERDFLLWRAEMPMQYVRREDYIRNQTIIEAKLDGLSQKLEIIQLKGNTP